LHLLLRSGRVGRSAHLPAFGVGFRDHLLELARHGE
jgi:hypothetical protein